MAGAFCVFAFAESSQAVIDKAEQELMGDLDHVVFELDCLLHHQAGFPYLYHYKASPRCFQVP